jgi:hypothetical protein
MDLIIISALGVMDLSQENKEARLNALNGVFKDLYDQQEIVQELQIDGKMYRENYNAFLLDNLMTIQKVDIKTVHESIVVNEIKADLKSYLPKVIQACDSISELFYGEMDERSWSHFGQLTEGLQWVGQSGHILQSAYAKNAEYNMTERELLDAFLQRLEIHIRELEAALQEQDFTAAGDLIKYEMPDTFNLLLESLESEVVS